MKFVLIHHRLSGFTSHHFNESVGFQQECGHRGHELVLLVNHKAPKAITRELRARAVFDDPTFRMEWSFEERSRRFAAQLHRHVDKEVGAGDCVMLTIATQLEAHALLTWLTELPERKKPLVAITFISDRWNRSTRAEYERQVAEFAKLRALIAMLSKDDANRVIFTGLTDLLVEELQQLLGTPHVALTPMPLPYGHPRQTPKRTRLRIAFLGGTRREKGSYLIPAILAETKKRLDAGFLVHLTNNSLTDEEVAALAVIRGDRDVEVIEDALPLPQYEEALSSADLCVFPYESIPYTKRTSGVFGEAVAFGKPVVVSPDTWMARQIASGAATGVVAEALEPEAIARAIADCAANLESLTRTAESRSEAWRKTCSLPAYFDILERLLAERAALLPPPAPRRRFLWFRR